MLLELSEVFVCPSCRPAQGMVVVVDRLDGRRVLEGRLGCPGCDLRVPVRRAAVRFDLAAGDGSGSGRDRASGAADAPDTPGGAPEDGRLPELLREAGPEEAAVRLAALLGADEAEGYLLLGPDLGALAAGVAARAPDAEVLALAREAVTGIEEGVARAVGVDPEEMPLFTGRMAGCALAAPSITGLREGTRVIREGARLVVLAPGPDCREAMEELPLRATAADERAVVAVREAGGFEAPFARFSGGPRPRSGGEAVGEDSPEAGPE